VGAECRANDVPFFLEPIAYCDTIGDEQHIAVARVKPAKVTQYMRDFSQPHYGGRAQGRGAGQRALRRGLKGQH